MIFASNPFGAMLPAVRRRDSDDFMSKFGHTQSTDRTAKTADIPPYRALPLPLS